MKNKHIQKLGEILPFGILTLALFVLSACATGQAVATGEVEGGDAYATYELGKVDPSPAGTSAQFAAVATLKRVSADLVAFTSGTLTQNELGAVTQTLQNQKLAISGNTQAVDQINNLLNIFSQQVVVGPGGSVTPASALATGVVSNIQKGFALSIGYFEGKWSVSNPGAAPTS